MKLLADGAIEFEDDCTAKKKCCRVISGKYPPATCKRCSPMCMFCVCTLSIFTNMWMCSAPPCVCGRLVASVAAWANRKMECFGWPISVSYFPQIYKRNYRGKFKISILSIYVCFCFFQVFFQRKKQFPKKKSGKKWMWEFPGNYV